MVHSVWKTGNVCNNIPRQLSQENRTTRAMDENIQAQQPTIDSNSGALSIERRPSLGEDPAAMTIEFLRARLLSERSVSKAARQRAQQLANKVLELEHQLDSEIQLRERFESARLEALSKYKDELISEYGNLFVSNSGDEDSDRTTGGPKEGISTAVASGSRNNDIDQSLEHGRTGDEGALQSNHLEDEEGASIGRMDNFDVGDSSRQANFEEDGNEGSFNDDEETELMGREKGILSWERRKGERRQQDKERGQNADLFGRMFSQKSFVALSADGESSQKRWVGKSVRQIRKKENRSQDTNSEDGPGQIQDSEDLEGKSSLAEDMKEGLQCDEERDTEVGRVLERQAELIERFEAEEDAQMEWEEKFRQQNPSLSNSSGQDSTPNKTVKEENTMASVRDEQSTKEEALCKESAGGLAGADDSNSNQLVGDVDSQQIQKVHLDDSLHKHTHLTEDKSSTPLQAVHNAVSEDSIRVDNLSKDLAIGATNEASIALDPLQEHGGALLVMGMSALLGEISPEERQPGTFEEPESNSAIEEAGVIPSEMDPPDRAANLSHDQALPTADTESIQRAHSGFKESQNLTNTSLREVSENQVNSSNTDLQGGEMHVRGPSVRHMGDGSPDLHYKKLSSFKFSAFHEHVNMLAEDVASSSSHQLLDLPPRAVSQGDFSFGLMPNAVKELRDHQERTSASGGTSAFSASEFSQKAVERSFYDQNLQVFMAPSDQQGLDKSQSVTSAKINVTREDTAGETGALVDTEEGITQRARSRSPWVGENGLTDASSSHASSDNLMKDAPWEEIFRRRMRTQDTGQDRAGQTKNSYGFPPYPDLRMQQPLYASAKREGIKLDNSPSLEPSRTAMPDSSAPWGYGAGSYVYQDAGGRINPRKSVDGGFDRVTEVLRVLEIAKHQIQSSDHPAKLMGDLDTAYKSGYDGREGLYIEPPNSYPVPAQMNLDSPAIYPASPQDSPSPAGYLGLPRFTVDSPYPAGCQVPPQFAVPGHAPYYSSLHGRGLKPFMPDLGGRSTAAGYARSPSPMQQSIPWAPQVSHVRNVYHHDVRKHR